MKPPQAWRPRPQIEGERPAAQDHLGLTKKAIALYARAGRTGALSQVAVHAPLGPGLPDLVVEPAAGVDDAEPRVEARDLRQLFIADRLDDEDVDRVQARLRA
jgi:hypothetical protein